MPSLRIYLPAFPLYPSAATATPVTPVAQVTQVKRKLIDDGDIDEVEQSMLGPTDPATISWNTGGPVTLGGPLSNLIASTLGYDTPTMTNFLEDCAAIVL
jgi:hypothetical protein